MRRRTSLGGDTVPHLREVRADDQLLGAGQLGDNNNETKLDQGSGKVCEDKPEPELIKPSDHPEAGNWTVDIEGDKDSTEEGIDSARKTGNQGRPESFEEQ